ncbi:MAG: FmdB family zinc ribbon protein [Burkholderiaceae bacterium]
MPIYAYRCTACGHAKDVLQKVSAALLTTCPACGAQAFQKQVTAAGFQLKGSGWYVTDFKGNGQKKEGGSDKGESAPSDNAQGQASAAQAKAADGNAGKSAETVAPASAAKPEKATDKTAGQAAATDKAAAKPPSSAGSGSNPA